MTDLIQAFVLGNAAILTNVCMLPLYPGLLAYMAGATSREQTRVTPWLGAVVLAGILSMMLLVGWLLFVLQASFAAVLPWLLPVIYATVIGFGVLMLVGRNPFHALSVSQAPLLQNRYLGAYAYGLLLGPMTLPCTGPLIVSAFLIGAGSAQALGSSLLYFVAFGLGFGWPLVVLPLVAQPFQRRFVHWTTGHYRALTLVSGLLLVLIGILGLTFEVIPNLQLS